MSEQELKALRVRIDSLDEKVLELISERARCAQEVARVKMSTLAEGLFSIGPSVKPRCSSG
jgi:chorismate mutase/prephenate dehydratase